MMNAPLLITTDELAAQFEGEHPPFLLDVMPAEEFAVGHIPWARNACVHETVLLEEVAKLLPDPETSVIVYDSGPYNLASTTAAEKLRGAGYTRVMEYREGLAEWMAREKPVIGTGPAVSTAVLRDGLHSLDPAKSRIEWIGRNLLNSHTGTISLRSGSLEIAKGQPVKGAFTLDMYSILNRDLEDPAWRAMLIAHLMSDDFFDVKRYPEATFDLLKATPLTDTKPGSPNYEISGGLCLKGVSRTVSFPAIIESTPEGVIAADAHLDIDRTEWNVLYGSGKFYEKLGKHLVNDTISLSLKLVTL